MTECYLAGEALDGAKVHIEVRKIIPICPAKSPTGFNGIKYKCSRNCNAVIEVQNSEEVIKKISEKSDKILTHASDSLKCLNLFIVHEGSKLINNLKVGMMSGRHECKCGTPVNRIYAEIEQPFEQIVNALNKKKLEDKGSKSLLE